MAEIYSKIAIIYGLIILLSMPLHAKLRQSIEQPDTLRLGSQIYLNLSAEMDLTDVVPPDTMSNFAITRVDKLVEPGKPAYLRLTIVVLDTGTQIFPALRVTSPKVTSDSLMTEAVTFNIRESRSPQDSTLVDIAGTQKLKGELPWWAYYLIGATLLLALLTAVIYLILKKKKARECIPSIPEIITDQRKPWQKALDALLELKKQNLPEQQAYITFHYNLSEIIKLFLEAELNFNANEMTTREIRRHFKRKAIPLSSIVNVENQPVPTPDVNLPTVLPVGDDSPRSALILTYADENIVLNCLESCDRVKFARHEPTPAECYLRADEMINWLQQYGKRKSDGQNATSSEVALQEQNNA